MPLVIRVGTSEEIYDLLMNTNSQIDAIYLPAALICAHPIWAADILQHLYATHSCHLSTLLPFVTLRRQRTCMLK